MQALSSLLRRSASWTTALQLPAAASSRLLSTYRYRGRHLPTHSSWQASQEDHDHEDQADQAFHERLARRQGRHYDHHDEPNVPNSSRDVEQFPYGVSKPRPYAYYSEEVDLSYQPHNVYSGSSSSSSSSSSSAAGRTSYSDFGRGLNARMSEAPRIAVDLHQKGADAFELIAEVPGLSKEDIKLTLEGRALTIQAERHSERADSSAAQPPKSYYREIRYGKASKTIVLPKEIDLEVEPKTKFENGVLTIEFARHPESVSKVKHLTIS